MTKHIGTDGTECFRHLWYYLFPPAPKACCSFSNSSGKSWIAEVDCPSHTPWKCCKDAAAGIFISYEVNDARDGSCVRKGTAVTLPPTAATCMAQAAAGPAMDPGSACFKIGVLVVVTVCTAIATEKTLEMCANNPICNCCCWFPGYNWWTSRGIMLTSTCVAMGIFGAPCGCSKLTDGTCKDMPNVPPYNPNPQR